MQKHAFTMRIERLMDSIREATLAEIARTSVRTVDKPGYDRFFAKLEGWDRELKSIRRQLRSMDAEQVGREAIVHGVPREHRYSAKQSINDKRSMIAELDAHAAGAAGALDDLYRRSLTPSDVDLINRGSKLIQDQIKAAQELEDLQQAIAASLQAGQIDVATESQARAVIVEARRDIQAPTPTGTPIGDPLILVSTLVTLIRMLLLARSKDK